MIYDCFTFFNELDVLDLRLHELSPVVDRFVLVEASQTFQGRPKPLHFADNRHRFRAFAEKIVHIVIDFPPVLDNAFARKRNQTWGREYHQREQLSQGLKAAQPDDLIIVSDVDEIVRASTLRTAIAQRPRHSLTIFDMPIHRFYVDRRASDGSTSIRSCPRMIEFSRFSTGQKMRMTRAFSSKKLRGTLLDRVQTRLYNLVKCGVSGGPYVVPDAGWHLTSLGGWKGVREKVEAYSHAEHAESEVYRSEAAYKANVRSTTTAVHLEELPRFVQEHRDRFGFFVDGADRSDERHLASGRPVV